ncbi:alkaline phosphatase family protein [Vibrio breoganii]
MTEELNPHVPLLIAGPILRRLSNKELAIWLVTSQDVEIKLDLMQKGGASQSYHLTPNSDGLISLSFSLALKYQLLDVTLDSELPTDCEIPYRLQLKADGAWEDVTELSPQLLYPGQESLQFRIPQRVRSLLHGSCRKPHYLGTDGLVEADNYVQSLIGQECSEVADDWPSMLVMSGDQIYADDVAGPMLSAIHQLSTAMGFPEERWGTDPDSDASMSSTELYQHPASYYQRDQLLPSSEDNRNLVKTLFGGAKKPIFTSTNADNHLISLGEYMACYLLSWSKALWQLVDLSLPDMISEPKKALYQQELEVIEDFISGLDNAQRVMAHLPVAMILDDHDITDDFNLHRGWEETVYNHPLSKRMIGNGMLAYLINQAWGNSPNTFARPMFEKVQQALNDSNQPEFEELLDKLIKLEAWDYEWQTSPPLIVLDTRTRRWRSETSATQPSGLLDWEALTELQNKLSGHTSVLLVSPAPIFGVKLIEVVQRIVTTCGYPLAVDAEYWMAHPGTAQGILNVFRHRKTPQNFVVLSGDVHYSFVYDVDLRGRNNSPDIWQVCSSGLRNSFPEPLLGIMDKLNRWLYSPRSPLNWFTRRRLMRITPRKPMGAEPGRRLLNHSGIGLVQLDEEGKPIKIAQLIGNNKAVEFEEQEHEANWH